jgi:hypothetical protein
MALYLQPFGITRGHRVVRLVELRSHIDIGVQKHMSTHFVVALATSTPGWMVDSTFSLSVPHIEVWTVTLFLEKIMAPRVQPIGMTSGHRFASLLQLLSRLPVTCFYIGRHAVMLHGASRGPEIGY